MREASVDLGQGDKWGLTRRSSAEKVAFLRALGSLERDPFLRNPDFLARGLLDDVPVARRSLALASNARAFHAGTRSAFERILPGAYWAEIARVKHFDEILLARVSAGVPQVVFLGAGLDSRPYRFPSELEGVGTFEVDHPVTASRKRKRVAALLAGRADPVVRVAVDLREESLERELGETGFDPTVPTLVLWIGVAPYLPVEDVSKVFDWVASLAPSSSLAFDYYDAAFFDEKRRTAAARRVRWAIERSGERLISSFEPEAVPSMLASRGLALKSHLGPVDQAARYLRDSRGEIAGRPISYANFVHAEVPSP